MQQLSPVRSTSRSASPSSLPSLSVVIPSYNARALLRRTLRTLAVAAPEAEVIVVDGASRDGSAAMVAEEFPSVRLFSHANHGFAHATNRGLEVATGDFILLLNSDLFVSRAALESMYSRLAADRWLGAVGPVLLNEDGTRQKHFGAFYWPNWVDVRKVSRVSLLSGACVMTRRDVLREVGGLDETFFLYNEEYDWCARLSRAGYHLEMVPERVVHVGGGSTPATPELVLEAQRGFLYLSQKHAHPAVTEGLRLLMLFEGFAKSRIDMRPAHREMWSQLESITRRGSYGESPFALSGRGEAPALPAWEAMERLPSGEVDVRAAAPAAAPAREEITRKRPVVQPPYADEGASVVHLAVERFRGRRAPKVAGATG